jgi:hypothetical protein
MAAWWRRPSCDVTRAAASASCSRTPLPEPARQAIIEAYPGAEVRLFSGGGHATSILKQEEYFAAIDRFLAS